MDATTLVLQSAISSPLKKGLRNFVSRLKFLQKITEKKQIKASEVYSRASLSRNRRLPARYWSNVVYNEAEDDNKEEEEEEDNDGEEEDIDEEEG